MQVMPIAVAGFASSWMLVWVGAASIPIVMHLLNRRKQQTVVWAAMQLLQRVLEKQSKRIRLEQLLLLIVRTAILLLLGLAVSRPYWSKQTSMMSDSSREARLWIVVLDTSYSMGFREGTRSWFTDAQLKAVEMVRNAAAGDAFAVVSLGEPSLAVVSQPTFDPEATIAALNRIKVLDTGADLSGALALIQEIRQQAQSSPEYPKSVHIAFFSDFGVDTWQAAITSGGVQKNLSELANACSLSFNPIGINQRTNVAITDLRSDKRRGLKNQKLEIEVQVLHTGAASTVQVPVQLLANGQSVESRIVELPPNSARSARFEYTPETEGVLQLSAQIPDDALSADNRRDWLVPIQDRFRVLVVENPYSDPRILKTALNPSTSRANGFDVDAINQIEFAGRDLRDIDYIFLNDINAYSDSMLQRLDEFVRSGRTLVTLLGPLADAKLWNELSTRFPLLGITLSEPSEFGDWRINADDYQNEILAPFAAYPDSGLLTTPIFRFWRLKPFGPDQAEWTTDVRLQEDHPFIIKRRYGQGWIQYLLSAPQTGSSVDGGEPWNAMAAWPSFVPLIQQMANSAAGRETLRLNVNVGDSLSGIQLAPLDRAEVAVSRPSGDDSLLLAGETNSNGQQIWTFSQTFEHGIYRIRQSDGMNLTYAVNIDARQSDLQKINLEQLPKSNATDEQALSGSIESLPLDMNSIARFLLVAVLMLLATESLLAWGFGRRLG